MNKASITNTISFTLMIFGYFSPIYRNEIYSVGIFSFSGAITNWLAVHMLFEKVPFLYGSGVIPNRFKEFKIAIKSMIMDQFFSEENLNKFFKENSAPSIDSKKLIESIDMDKIFNGLLEVVQQSSLGGMLAMFGGVNALDSLKEPFQIKMKEILSDITKDDNIAQMLSGSSLSSSILIKIETIVDKRLEELTPKKVKEIVGQMIREHLGWLVVWGGVFGGLIGLVASFI